MPKLDLLCHRCWNPIRLAPDRDPPYSLPIRASGDEPLLLLLCPSCSARFPDDRARDAFLSSAWFIAPFDASVPTDCGVRVVAWERPRCARREAA